jgi:hypothetical protein
VTARIVGATLRDLSYIAANLRPDDHAEIDCQFTEWSPAMIAAVSMQGMAYVVEIDGNPEAAFGAHEDRQGLWTAWSWGTRRMWRCVPRITRFFFTVLGPDVAAQGAWRVEARSLAGNALAERWLTRLGATRRCDLPRYGKDGQGFVLWDWTRDSWANVHRKPVLKAENPQAQAPAHAAAS